MVARVAQYTLDVEDVDRMAAFWSAALGYRVDQGGDGSAKLWPPAGTEGPTVWLQGSGTPKRGKNRLHLDLVGDGDPGAEVARLVALGARRADVGQTGDERFVVLADPEDNEFCVLDHPPS
ncbi:VOC family protein [Micromonospora krabiensis]|uniref:Glyoxalase-like domain-containing protein n=1 Tax=Micromonospora krabiensis TaxID=307121 RepID=A0A1C3N6B3_9ACTN|nr:VOC family protein [Micromonospora krabiensis]SBV28117.1 Glyoxalase-like domain-containing protein [Micromonospora krabiensis]